MYKRISSILDHSVTPRILFSGLLLAFAVQVFVMRTYGDVYPALVMPGLPGTGVLINRPVKADPRNHSPGGCA